MRKFLHFFVAVVFFIFSILPMPCSAFDVNVVEGDASVKTEGNTTTITATGRAVLEGVTSIPTGTIVNIIQANNDILLRDTSGKITNILGSLISDGRIVLINSYGVFIAQAANIDVKGLMASTLNIKNELFMNGNYHFERVPGLDPAQIINEANIKTKAGGFIVLLADRIENKGTITAYMGSVALASGQQVTVSFDPKGLINLVVDKGLAEQLKDSDGNTKDHIVNSGDIHAAGGKVQVSAQLLKSTINRVVNNTGVIEALAVSNKDGSIELLSSGAIDNSGEIHTDQLNEKGYTFNSSGTLDVRQAHYDNLDGAIDVSGSISGSHSDTGNINFTGAVNLTGDTTLTADSGTPDQSGRIIMNGFSLTGNNNNLTLTTGENNTLDGSITGVNLLTTNSSTVTDKTFTSTGGSFSATTVKTNYHSLFSRSQGAGIMGNPYMIYSVSNVTGGLQNIPTRSLSAYYQLANNIDATETSSWNAGSGFSPIGDPGGGFTGSFDGNNKTINALFINRPATNEIGLLGRVSAGATVQNVGMTNVNITGQFYVGGLAGYTFMADISDSYSTGTVSGATTVGGLVGFNTTTNIDDSYSTANISASGSGIVGGLLGYNSGTISDSYATGNITGNDNVGGLIGNNVGGSDVSNSYATGNVSGDDNIGGLIGYNADPINRSYATGSVNGDEAVGGLVGNNDAGVITNSYATGIISGVTSAGGLVGINDNAGLIYHSYARGAVSGTTGVGGLVGLNDGSDIINTYATGTSSGVTMVGGLVGNNSTGTAVNSYSTGVATASGGTPGGLIGTNAGGTYFNTWWYNSTNTLDTGGGNLPAGEIDKASAASDFFNPGYSVYDPYNLGGSRWTFGGGSGSVWAPVVNNTSKTASFPILSWQSGASFMSGAGTSGDPYLITNVGQLALMLYNLDKYFTLSNDIHADVDGFDTGTGFLPVGTLATPFTGFLEGNNKIIDSLYINRPSMDYVGLFGSISTGATLQNVGLTNAGINGRANVGGLVGYSNSSTVSKAFVTGTVTGTGNYVGGLVGYNFSFPFVQNSYSTATVSGVDYVGGLVGYNSFVIARSYASGNVSGVNYVGGLAGYNDADSIISYDFATGNVSGVTHLGGLLGDNGSGIIITTSYFIDSSHDNGYGTLETSGISAFYNPLHPVYSGWSIGTPLIWDTYVDELPHLHLESHTGNINSIWTGATSTDWATAGNWSTGQVPGSTSTAYILTGSNNPTLGSSASVGTFGIASGIFTQNAALTILGNYSQTGGTFTGSNASLDIDGNVTISAGTLTASSGNFTVGGIWSKTGGVFTPGTNTVTFDGSGTQTLASGGSSFYNLTHAGTGTLRLLTNNLSVTGVLINSNGTFDANDRTNTVTGLATVSGGEYQTKSGDHAFNGGLTISGGVFTGGTADITLTDLTLTSGTLIIPSGSFSLTGNWSKTGGTFTPGTNFVSFDGSGTQTLNSGGSSFYNLTHTGSGTLQLSTNNLAVTGIFSNNASAGTFNANGLTNTVTGLTTVSGGTYQASTATQTFNGGLIVSGGVFMGSSGTVDVNGNLTLSAGTLTAPSGNLNVSGNWTHSAGTFNHNNGTVNLDGVNQSIVGSNTFNNLLKIISTSETLTFDDGSPQTIAGTLTLQGQADQLLFLRSNLSASQWLIDIQGGMNLTYLDVMDSQVIGSLADCSLGCIDSGNNIRWNFLEVSPTEQQDILLGVAPENTKRAHYNSSVIFIEGKKNDPQSIKGYLMTYGRHWGGIYGRWMEHIVEANQALSRPWGFELLPMVYMGGGNIQ